MRSLTYLVNATFWLIPTMLCVVFFFPLALIPIVGMVLSHSRLNRMYSRKDENRRHKEMLAAITAGNSNTNQGA